MTRPFWLRAAKRLLTGRTHSPITNAARRGALRCEALEDRAVPAVLSAFLTTEHVDLDIGYTGGAFSLRPHDDDNSVGYAADEALLYVGTPALTTRQSGAAFDFIGVAAGASFYRLPAAQDAELLYLGVEAGVTPSDFDRYNPSVESKGRVSGTGRWVKMTLIDVDHTTPAGAAGSGKFSAWQSGDSGPNVFMSNFNDNDANPNPNGLDATDGIGADDALWVVAGGHSHFNFGFTETGRYEVTFKLSGRTPDGNDGTAGALFESGNLTAYFSVNSVGQLEFDSSSYTVNEGAGTASVNVRRVGGSDGQITVNYATSNGTATAGSDYTATSGTLTFNDQETQKTITVPITNDAVVESNETINLTLSASGPSSINGYLINFQDDANGLIGTQATATLTILDNDAPTGTPPTISDVADQTTDEDTPKTVDFTVGDDQTPAADLSVTASSSNATLVPNANLVLGGSGANRTVTITPAANLFGTATITLTVTDASGQTATDTFVLTVTAVNDTPVAVGDFYSVNEDTTLTVGGTGVLGNDTDADGDTLKTALVAGPANGRVVLNPDGSFSYTPNANFNGTDTFTYTVTDVRYELTALGTLGGNSSFAVDVNNSRQVTGNSSITAGSSNPLHAFIWQNGVFTDLGVVPGTGANNFSRGFGLNDAGVVVGESDNNVPKAFRWENGTLTNIGTLGGTSAVAHDINTAGTIVGISNNGTASKPFVLLNGGTMTELPTGGPATATGRAWSISADGRYIIGVARTAASTAVSHASLWERQTDGSYVQSDLGALVAATNFSQAYAVNNDGVAVGSSVVGKVSPTSSTDLYHGFISAAGALLDVGTLAYRPTFIHSELKDISAGGQFVGYVAQFFGSPTSGGAAVLGERVGTGTAMIDLNQLIPAGSGMTLATAEGINDGRDIVGFGSNGSQTRGYLLTPATTDNDGRVFANVVTVTITVGPVNDAPTATPQSLTIDEDAVTPIALAGTDPDGDALTYTIVTGPAHGTLSGTGANRTYTPNADYNGSDNFTFKVNDGTVDSATATVLITITAVNDAPVAAADAYTVSAGNIVHGNVLFNDSDAEGDALAAAVVTAPAAGVLALNADGTFTYTPGAGFTGTDSFTYRASAGGANSDPVTVTITAAGFQNFAAVLSTEHTDIGLAYEDDAWDLHVHDEDNDVEFAPNEVLLHVGPQALTTRTGGLAGAEYDFLGVAAGESLYRLPQTQNPELLYLGIGAEEIAAGTFQGGQFQLRLKAVNGPGHFSLWFDTDTGPDVRMATSDGITADDFAVVLEGGHQDYNFGFTVRGRYEVTFEAVATLPDGTPTSSGDVTYYFSADNLGRFQFDGTAVTVAEGGDATLTVLRVGGSDGVATVNVGPTGGTAVEGIDYAPFAGTLTFGDGETVKSFVVSALTDAAAEPSETVIVALTAPADGPTQLGVPATTVLTITDVAPVVTPPLPGGARSAQFIVLGSGDGRVQVLNATNRTLVREFTPFAGYVGAVAVAAGDVDGDGVTDVIAAAGNSHVKVFSGSTGAELLSVVAFPGYAGSVSVAAGDMDGDGKADVVVGTAVGSSHVKVFSGATGAELRSFLAFPGYLGGVRVAAADVVGDGKADIIVVANAGGNGHVKAFDGATGAAAVSFLGYPGYAGEVGLAAGDVDGDGRAEIVTVAQTTAGTHVRAFSASAGTFARSYFAPQTTTGFGGSGAAAGSTARVAVGDVTGDGVAEVLLTSPPKAGPSRLLILNGATQAVVESRPAFDDIDDILGFGVFVGLN